MTHSLHRSGTIESLKNDFVWMWYPAKGVHGPEIQDKARSVLEIAEACGTTNWGDVKLGSVVTLEPEDLKARLTRQSRIRGVFHKREQVARFLKEMKKADYGVPVVISGLLGDVFAACEDAGVAAHTVNYSLGVWGKRDLLPDENILAMTTMCGHHMISPRVVANLRERVRKGSISPKKAARKIAALCPCGIFNEERAAELLAEWAAKDDREQEERDA